MPSADWMDSLGAGEDAGVCCDPIERAFGDYAFGAIGPLELMWEAGVGGVACCSCLAQYSLGGFK